jgi:methylenetetrahydrofolate dehydrogenase (NADP+)/methenyltetrahydrofolate cyclohydrolase
MTETTTYTLIDGRKVSADIKNEIAQNVAVRKKEGKKIPHLAIIVVGDDGASQTYVDNKVKACKEVGFHYTMMRFADTISEEKLLKHIDHVNNDDDVDGFIVQLPLPDHISVERVTQMIRSDKDVDGFTNHNFGSIISKNPLLMPATPFGVMELLRRYNIETEGKHAVVVGASRIAGAPLSMMLTEQGHATVTICHKYARGSGQARPYHRGYGQRGRCRDRYRHDACGRAAVSERLGDQRRRRLQECRAQSFLYHTGAWRRWTHDDRFPSP